MPAKIAWRMQSRSAGVPPQEGSVLVAEKRKLSFSLLKQSRQPTSRPW